jgi:hypothetical protein
MPTVLDCTKYFISVNTISGMLKFLILGLEAYDFNCILQNYTGTLCDGGRALANADELTQKTTRYRYQLLVNRAVQYMITIGR